ncbi:MAG: type II toxin-antitoxin system PemK/MazF family toxin [Calditrichaeota bacterium]|nr:MAG: type II toxin-antitoxin system PemK/MazF family toxin [Calditrichota bacterium]
MRFTRKVVQARNQRNNRAYFFQEISVYNAKVPVIQVVPVTEWNEKKRRIVTNVEIEPDSANGFWKKAVADCLQTRPIDHRHRLRKIRGKLDDDTVRKIDVALKRVFDLE